MARRVRHPDPEAEPAARNLMNIRGAVGKILDRAGVDRRDRGGEFDALGGQRQRGALRHIAEDARHIETRKAATLGLLCDIERDPPPSGHGDKGEGGQWVRHVNPAPERWPYRRRTSPSIRFLRPGTPNGSYPRHLAPRSGLVKPEFKIAGIGICQFD